MRSSSGTVESIHIAPGAGEPTATVERVMALTGVGLEGDRIAIQALHADAAAKRAASTAETERVIIGAAATSPQAGDAGEGGGLVEPKRQVTLIEAEALEALAHDYDVHLSAGESRRNICTRGVALNHLVGRTFRVGGALLRGIKLCEPCEYMEKLSGRPGARKGLVHRGGLRAEVVHGGLIRRGDPVEAAQ